MPRKPKSRQVRITIDFSSEKASAERFKICNQAIDKFIKALLESSVKFMYQRYLPDSSVEVRYE